MDQKPSIGRIVHYFPAGASGQAYPAIVTCVHSDECVNLFVFDDGTTPTPDAGPITSIARRQAEGEESCWDWPPRV